MITISGITISNPSDTTNSVLFQIIDESLNVVETINYTGQSEIYFQEYSAGTYHVKMIDGTSSEVCEVDKNITTIYEMYIGTGFNDTIFGITETSDGKYLVGGAFTSYSGDTSNKIIRLNSDGRNDSGFDIGTGFSGFAVCNIMICSDGKYLISGRFNMYDGTQINKIVRVYSDGTVDNTFRPTISSYYPDENDQYIYKTLETSDDKYIVVGMFTVFDNIGYRTINRIIRLYNDGTIDTSFGSGIIITDNWIKDIIKTSDNKYLICGGFNNNNHDSHVNYFITKLTLDGNWDNTFLVEHRFDGFIESVIETSEGDYLIGGHFSTFSGDTASGIIKLDIYGNVVSSFNSGSGFTFTITGGSGNVYDIIETSDGGYLVGGHFLYYNGVPASCIVKLTANGDIDPSFDYGSGFNMIVYKLSETLDGRYLIGGGFTSYNGTTSNRIIKLNTDGSVNSIADQ